MNLQMNLQFSAKANGKIQTSIDWQSKFLQLLPHLSMETNEIHQVYTKKKG